MRKRESGSWLELLIVVAIICLLVAITKPTICWQPIIASEASAIGTLRTLNAQAQKYAFTYGNGFPRNLSSLGPPPVGHSSGCNYADLIDSALATGQKTGYGFTYAGADPIASPAPPCANPGFNSFTIKADPIVRGKTGGRSFFTDQSGTIHYNAVQPATATDPSITDPPPIT